MTGEQKHLVRSYAQRVAVPDGIAIVDVPIRYRDAVIDCLSDVPDHRWRLQPAPPRRNRRAAQRIAEQYQSHNEAALALMRGPLSTELVNDVLELVEGREI